MPLMSKTLAGLINGVSRQPYPLHLDSQGYEMLNCLANTSKGVLRRHGSSLFKHFQAPDAATLGEAWHFIDRDTTHRYALYISAAATKTVRLIDLITAANSPAAPTISAAAQTYLNAATATDLVFLTVGDTTYIVDPAKNTAMASTTVSTPDPVAFVWVKSAIQYVSYYLTLKNGSTTTTYPIGSYGNGKNTSSVTDVGDICTGIVNTLNGVTLNSNKIRALQMGQNTVAIFMDNNSGTPAGGGVRQDFSIEASDGWGNAAMSVFKSTGSIQNFAELPVFAPDGFLLKVQGDPDSDQGAYYVKFTANTGIVSGTVGGVTLTGGRGIWAETTQWGAHTTIDSTTMPLVLHWNGTEWFLGTINGTIIVGSSTSWTPPVWGTRAVGDETTAPDPSFIGFPIRDMVFYQNRLGLVAGESICFSGVNDFYNFFATSVITAIDDDVVDLTANFAQVAKFRYAASFNDLVVLFAESGIYGVRLSVGATAFTAKSAQMLKLTNFAGKPSCRPRVAGDRIFFTEVLNAVTYLREFFAATDTAYVVESASEHVKGYIDDPRIAMIAADGVKNIVLLLGHLFSPASYVYQYFFSNREKVQSAWHRWWYAGKKVTPGVNMSCVSVALLAGDVWTINYNLGTGSPSYFDICKIQLDDTNDFFYDQYQTFSSGGSFSGGNTTFTVPSPYYGNMANSAAEVYVYDVTSSLARTPDSVTPSGFNTLVTFNGVDIHTHTIRVGLIFRSTYEFTLPIVRDSKGAPMLGGRYLMRRFRPRFESLTTFYTHVVTLPKTDDYTVTRRALNTSKRECQYPVMRPVDANIAVGVHTEQPTQDWTLYAVTWEFQFDPRGGRSI